MKYYFDMFSGIGGFALGAKWAGADFDGHYFSEVDGYGIRIYQKRFKSAVGLGDIREVDYGKLPPRRLVCVGRVPVPAPQHRRT
jgi:site-specific DNA-cytosine methylase